MRNRNTKERYVEILSFQHFANYTTFINMDLGKLLFMGLIPTEKRGQLINEIIILLEKELSELLEIQISIQESDEREQMIVYLKNDPEYCMGIQKATKNLDIIENMDKIGDFEAITLQYGIDSTKFQIKWFKSLKNNLEQGGFINEQF